MDLGPPPVIKGVVGKHRLASPGGKSRPNKASFKHTIVVIRTRFPPQGKAPNPRREKRDLKLRTSEGFLNKILVPTQSWLQVLPQFGSVFTHSSFRE